MITLNANVFETISILQLVNFTASARMRWYANATNERGIATILAQNIEFISSDDKEMDLWKSFFEEKVVDKARFEKDYLWSCQLMIQAKASGAYPPTSFRASHSHGTSMLCPVIWYEQEWLPIPPAPISSIRKSQVLHEVQNP